MAEPKLLIPLNEQRPSVLPKGAQVILDYNSKRGEQKKSGSSGSANTSYKPSYSAQRVNAVATPELDRAVGNTPDFVAPSSAQSEDFVAPSSNEEEEKTGFGNLLFRSLMGGAASSLGAAANDVGYRSQMTQPAQEAENAYWKSIADGTGGIQLNNEQDELALFMGVPTTGAQKAYEETYKTESAKPIELKRAVDWGDAYNAETQRRYANVGAGQQIAADVASAVGGMLPSMAVRAIPVVGPALAQAMLFSQASGSAIDQALADGASNEGALNYGAAVGAAELASEKLFGGLAKLYGKGAADDIIETLTKKIAKSPNGQKAAALVLNSLGEGVEEGAVSVFDPVFKSLYNNKSVWENLGDLEAGDVFYDMLVGTLTGMAIEGGSAIAMRGAGGAQADQATTEESSESESAPPVEEEVAPAEPGQQNPYTPGSRNHANAVMSDPQMLEQFAKDAGRDINELRNMPKAELRKLILNHYRGNQQTPEPKQEGTTPLADALLGEQPVEEGTDESDVLSQLQAGDKLVDEAGNVVAEIKNVTPYGITYIDSDGYDDMIPLNNPDGESIFETLGASNGHFERPDGTWVGKNPKPAPEQNTPIADAILGEQTQDAAQQTVAQPSPAITGERQVLPPVVEDVEQTVQPNVGEGEQAPGSAQPAGSTLNQTTPTDPNRPPKDSQTWETVRNSDITPDYMASLIDNEGQKGAFRFIPITNSETVQQAVKAIREKGWVKAYGDWVAQVRAGQAGEQVTAIGALLYNNAVTAGDEMLALDILADYHAMLRNTARGLQAGRIIKTLTPSSRLYMIQREVANLAEELKLPDGITISQELQQEYLNAKTEAERDKAIKKMQKHVAKQIPSTFLDKWTALRYVNMLGNFKTQGRNLIGNTAMRGTAGFKNLIATSLEHLVYSKDSGKRTKSFVVSKELKAAARKDFDVIKDIVLGESKYSTGEAEGFMKGVEKERQIFKFMPLEVYRKLTNMAMEGGDILFSKSAYARALAGNLKANGVSADLFSKVANGEVEVDRATRDKIDRARTYAIQEAQEDTFRDNNAFSSWISKVGRRPDTPKAGKLLSEGIMPFRKTPANVLVRAEEYSPLGLVNTAVKAVQAHKGTNDITGSDVINSLSKSLTGTGIFLVGMALRNAGWLTGGEDDEEQAGFDSLTGQQEYALSLPGDVNITLDWLSPASIPLFMGVQLMDEIEDGGFQLKDLEASLTSITDPLIQMSMLQGANDTLDSIKYSDNNLVQIGVNAALSYLTQGLTNSLLGQAERTSESHRMETFRDRESNLPVWLQTSLGKASAKTPGWDYNQVDYVDAWGRTTDYKNPLMNAFNQFLNPSYTSEERISEVETELQRLYDLDDPDMPNVFPERRGQSDKISVRDEDGNIIDSRYLTADEYVQANRTQGQTSFKLVSELMSSDAYASMGDDQKAEAIAAIYDYARDIATKEAEPTTKLTGLSKKAYEASQKGIDFTAWYGAYSEWKRLSETKQEGYSSVDKATDFARWVDTAGFTKEQADTLKGQLTFSSGFTAETTKYNDLTRSGVSAEVADSIYDAVSSLEPVNFGSSVANWQKYEAIAGSGASATEIEKALKVYMGDSNNDHLKYDVMRAGGYTPQEFATAFHYYKTATSEANFIKLVTAAGVGDAKKLYALMEANKKELANWKW